MPNDISGKILYSNNNNQMTDNNNVIRDDKIKEENLNAVTVFAVKRKLLKIREEINEMLSFIAADSRVTDYERKILSHISETSREIFEDAVKIVEGIFDGVQMVGNDGEKYDVPANYASKSKLVEGDILKLRIMRNGILRYKQIEKVERVNIVGILHYNEETKEYTVVAESGITYKVLAASVSYYKGEPGDPVVIILPKDKESRWAAVENINKKCKIQN